MLKHLLLLLLIFYIPAQAGYMYTLGTYVPHAFTAQADREGGTEGFAINPSFSLGTQFHAFDNHFFSPEIGFVYHRDTFDDVKQSTMFFLYILSYRLTGSTILRYGLGTFWEKFSGDGGSVVLSNGTGSAVFYKPDGSTTTYHTDLMFGAEQFFKADTSVRFDLTFTGWKSDALDNKNYILTLNFYIL